MFNRSGAGNYSYTSARVKAKKADLLKEEDYNKMLMMSVPEISHYISEAGYSKEMAELGNRYAGLSLVEYATYANMAKAFRSILNSSTGGLSRMVSAYLTKWDFENIKTIMRGKKYGLPVEEIREDLVPAGILSMEDLDKLIAMASIEDIVIAFSKKVHVAVPDDVMAAYKTDGVLGAIEDVLLKEYYKNLLDSITSKDRPTQIFRNYVKACIDIKNVETVLKFKADGITGEAVMGYWIPGGSEIDEKVMSQLAAAKDIPAAINEMQQLRMYSEIKDSLTQDSTILDIVGAIEQYETLLANKVGHTYPLSVIPVVDYMIHKEKEVRNIRMIAHGIDSGLDRDTMKKLLVI